MTCEDLLSSTHVLKLRVVTPWENALEIMVH